MNLFGSKSAKQEELRDAANAAITRIQAFDIKLRRLNKSIAKITEVSRGMATGRTTPNDLAEASDKAGTRVAEANEVLNMLKEDLKELFSVLDV